MSASLLCPPPSRAVTRFPLRYVLIMNWPGNRPKAGCDISLLLVPLFSVTHAMKRLFHARWAGACYPPLLCPGVNYLTHGARHPDGSTSGSFRRLALVVHS